MLRGCPSASVIMAWVFILVEWSEIPTSVIVLPLYSDVPRVIFRVHLLTGKSFTVSTVLAALEPIRLNRVLLSGVGTPSPPPKTIFEK